MTSTTASAASHWGTALIALLLHGAALAATAEESTFRTFLAQACKLEVAKIAQESADARVARMTFLRDEKTQATICGCVEEQITGDMVMGNMLDATRESADPRVKYDVRLQRYIVLRLAGSMFTCLAIELNGQADKIGASIWP